ncbi:signal peptidase I [Cytobacillus purgationiresistens]|uniref:Signal peptidase I n=1 Tax=Cytobacillus purgationiresistens TaxID=863449 RepID=A0ABU0AGK4_9BACI|nr:signal peptidase I [Cytobacillus purgationiresistens]MDQ0270388.1 signal peptidase I [Cytobacillus purgationiresistens]
MKESTKKEIYSWVKSIVFAFIITFICRVFIFIPTTVFGESMLPTFNNEDRIVVSKTSEIQRSDVIVFDAPDMAGKQYIKRVIGLPGDSIEMKDDVLLNDSNGAFYSIPEGFTFPLQQSDRLVEQTIGDKYK